MRARTKRLNGSFTGSAWFWRRHYKIVVEEGPHLLVDCGVQRSGLVT